MKTDTWSEEIPKITGFPIVLFSVQVFLFHVFASVTNIQKIKVVSFKCFPKL